MAVFIKEPYSDLGHFFADVVFEQNLEESKLLDQDRRPLLYPKQKLGFDLTSSRVKHDG
jgi:hypothetical protein